VHQPHNVSGLQTADVIQEEIFMLLFDYGCMSEEMRAIMVPIAAQPGY
jgi:hypothetical protein